MTSPEIIAIIASILTIICFAANVIQYNQRHSLVGRLRSFAQGTYMDHYMIARACARVRTLHADMGDNIDALIAAFWRELQYINGIADSARNNIISVSEQQLGFTPVFRHPALPERKEFDGDIMLGMMPETTALRGSAGRGTSIEQPAALSTRGDADAQEQGEIPSA